MSINMGEIAIWRGIPRWRIDSSVCVVRMNAAVGLCVCLSHRRPHSLEISEVELWLTRVLTDKLCGED